MRRKKKEKDTIEKMNERNIQHKEANRKRKKNRWLKC